MLVHVGSFFPTILHALHIKHLVEDVAAEPLNCILIYSPRQTIIFSFWGNKISRPISVVNLNQHANQVLRKDRCEPTLQNMASKYIFSSKIKHISIMLMIK